ncbi:DUF4396 domain-containing protein [Streptomyces xiaopingdaonensis]|uniref:DUF4396 domain-containing protein n=1 Tax=Streptomyces xiaopingdaonensis TaxID=1565415 RepID=UPI0002F367D9|nr:DUF4396 domain-containing protein [Streptomyces xiaopingdaonensis]
MLLDGVMLLWFLQVAIAVVFVAFDIRTTPEATVMKWGFVVITLFSGLFGALLYVLSCREPLPGTHEQYVAAKWRQVVGSTMHCVAGDGIGILAAAVITDVLGLPRWADVLCEYAFGFAFGWSIFQALFMKDMFGSYHESLSKTFLPELLSMNAVMGGMTAVMVPWMTNSPLHPSPAGPNFWFIMSMALCAGFLVALPMNWWLVDHGLKHGMMTVRRTEPVLPASGIALAGAALAGHRPAGLERTGHSGDHGTGQQDPGRQGHETSSGTAHGHHAEGGHVPQGRLAIMTVVSFLVWGAGFLIAGFFGNLTM